MDIINMEERLWEYIDGQSNEQEKGSVEQLLRTNAEWKAKYAELLGLNQILASSELEEPSMRFAQNVMEEITKYHITPATKTYINKKLVYGIGGFLVTMIVGLLIYFFAQIDWSGGTAGTGFAEDLGRVKWGEVLNNTYVNIFLMINVVLGLMLLDRYLSAKKTSLKERKA